MLVGEKKATHTLQLPVTESKENVTAQVKTNVTGTPDKSVNRSVISEWKIKKKKRNSLKNTGFSFWSVNVR